MRGGRLSSLVLLVLMVLLAGGVVGCHADEPGAAPGSVLTDVPSEPASPTVDPTPSVRPHPPVAYRPAQPEVTVRNAQGYLVDRCVPPRLRGDAIALTDSDGVHLSGLLLGSGTDAVLLSHEQGYNVCSFLPLAERLAAHGLLVLLPEYRNHGASERVADNEHLGRDAEAGLAELHRRGATRVFVGGASCGGTASILVGAPIADELTGLLIMSSPARCGLLDAVPAVRRITAPSLFIVSPGDMLGAVEEQVRALYAASGATDKKLVIDDSGYHGTDMFRESDHGAALQRRVLRFVLSTFAG